MRTEAKLSSDVWFAEHLSDTGGDLLHFGLAETASGDCRAAEPDAARVQRRVDIERNSIFIDGNICVIQSDFRLLAANTLRKHVDQH